VNPKTDFFFHLNFDKELTSLCETEEGKAIVSVIQDMFFDLDTDEFDEDYIAEHAERIDGIVLNG
jgi:hypothetical protein